MIERTSLMSLAVFLSIILFPLKSHSFQWDLPFTEPLASQICEWQNSGSAYPNPGYYFHETNWCQRGNQCGIWGQNFTISTDQIGCFYSNTMQNNIGPYFAYHPTNMDYNPGQCLIEVEVWPKYTYGSKAYFFEMSATGATVTNDDSDRYRPKKRFSRRSMNCSKDLMELGVSWGVVSVGGLRFGPTSTFDGKYGGPGFQRNVFVDGVKVGDDYRFGTGLPPNPVPVACDIALDSSVIDHGVMMRGDEDKQKLRASYTCTRSVSLTVGFYGGGNRTPSGYRLTTDPSIDVNLCLETPGNDKCIGGASEPVMTLSGQTGEWYVTSSAGISGDALAGEYSESVVMIAEYR